MPKKGKLIQKNLSVRIAVCIHETMAVKQIKPAVDEAKEKYRNVSFSLTFFDRPGADLTVGKKYDIILLDIGLNGCVHVETAREIRKHDKKVKLIFIADNMEYVNEAFRLNAYRYLNKQNLKVELSEALNDILAESKRIQTIELECGGVCRRILLKDILCAESLGDEAVIYFAESYVTVRQTLYGLHQQLGSDFYRSHKSCIVNLRHIEYITDNTVTLKTGKTLPVAARRKTGLKEAYREYINNCMD